MTTISAKIIADSISLGCPRLTTLELTYPRFIHAEFMTHRVFSRNASSSRAIPVAKQIQMIQDNPAVPLYWGKNQKGMQATEDCDNRVACYYPREEYFEQTKETAWLHARDNAVEVATAFNDAGYHKQIVNRLLEPFAHITVVVTATEWDNFFDLRLHKDAEPHMQHLAREIKKAFDGSVPKFLYQGEWHLPYITEEDWNQYPQDILYGGDGWSFEGAQYQLLKVSVARCARTSYLNHDGTRTSHGKDIDLHDTLVVSRPIHASPAEHQATPNSEAATHQSGNLRGWSQYRKIIENGKSNTRI